MRRVKAAKIATVVLALGLAAVPCPRAAAQEERPAAGFEGYRYGTE
jgi:hypothetical protein